jgi:hypothetical protein
MNPGSQSLILRVTTLALFLCALSCTAQQTKPAVLSGYTTDPDGADIPGATISIDGPTAQEHYATTSDAAGFFEIIGVRSGVAYRVSATATGFSAATEEHITLTEGQVLEIQPLVLTPRADIQVTAVTAEEAALAEVKQEESQRVLGIVPNFFVVYGNGPYVPLPAKLKFRLALKAATDPVTFGSVAFLSGLDQAAFTPSYVEGAKGYFQRFGANYADTASDVLLGGAILPSIFHQDPRYFVQGTGTKKSRAWHAIEAPFIAKGDNGHLQFNISSIGGDVISGALSNVYYPPADRGVGLMLNSAGVTTIGRIANALFQEFLFGKFTTGAKHQ